MFRLAASLIILIFIISACNAVATPLPVPSATPRPSATATVSNEDLTAGAAYRLTLPASFTPTFTASHTPTPTPTSTASNTPMPTTVPEDVLCDNFIVGPAYTTEAVDIDDIGDLLQIYLPYNNITVNIEVRNVETGEVVEYGSVTGGFPVYLNLSPTFYPEIGDYEWTMTVQDATRSGLCERQGSFDTRADELPQAELTAEVTVESTAEVTAEATLETTAEVTNAVEVTATATLNPVRFPPR